MTNNSRIIKDLPTILSTEQGHVLMCPNGSIVPGIIWTRVNDHVGQVPYVLMKVQCNIAMSGNEFKEDTPEVIALKGEIQENKELIRHLRSELVKCNP